jgi:hypothetical protein
MSRIVIGRLPSWRGSRWGMVLAGVVVPIAVVAGTLWLVGDGGSNPSAPPSDSPSASVAPSGVPGSGRQSPAPGSSSAPAGGTPSAGAATDDATSGFLTEVAAINVGLVADPARAVAAGRATCQVIGAGKSDEEVVATARQHFGVRDLAITEVMAVLLVSASHNHLCPG